MTERKGPVFQGLASPSLKKMGQMSDAELDIHINKLDEHAAIIRAKLQRQQQHPQPPAPRKVKAAQRQLDRLDALAQYARDLLAGRRGSTGYSRDNR